MDATDIRIIREMGIRPYGAKPRDPDAQREAAIAKRLHVDLKTVKARVERMREAGFLRGHQIVPNLCHFGLEGAGYLYRIPDPDAKREALQRVESTDVLLEIHDFLGPEACIDVAYRSPEELASKLKAIGDIAGDPAPVRFYDRVLPRVDRELSPLDWRILLALRGRAHRLLADVAGELGVTLKTVRRRFDRMASEGSFFVVPMLDPSRATGLVLFELLVYTSPNAAPGTQKLVLDALEDNYVYHYAPASRSLGNFDVLLFGDAVAAVERARSAARSIPGVSRVDALLFQGWSDHSAWMDEASPKRPLAEVSRRGSRAPGGDNSSARLVRVVIPMAGTQVMNGIDTKALGDMMDAVRKQPQVARSTFRVATEVKSGFASHSSTRTPTLGGGPIQGRKRTFSFEGGHPPELLGHDEGPAGVETLLAALGACVGSGFTTFGAAMGIPIERVEVDLTGDLDLQGFMGLPAPGVVRPGYERIHATIRVKSRASRDQLEKLKEVAEGASPVKDSLRAVAYTSELVVEA